MPRNVNFTDNYTGVNAITFGAGCDLTCNAEAMTDALDNMHVFDCQAGGVVINRGRLRFTLSADFQHVAADLCRFGSL